MRLVERAEELAQARAVISGLEEELKAAKAREAEMERRLYEQMVDEEQLSFRCAVGSVTMRRDLKPSAIKEREEELFAALRAQGQGDAIKETIHAGTFGAMVRDLIRDNDDKLPQWLEGMVRLFEKEWVSITKT